MKCEPHMCIDGSFSIEVIAETDLEFSILSQAWKLNGYERANGRTRAPQNGGGVGFYVPLGKIVARA